MLECALYTYITSLSQLDPLQKTFNCRKTEYTESVYTKDDTLFIVKSSKNKSRIIKKKQVDKNRNRKHVLNVVETSETKSNVELISLLAQWEFKCIITTQIEEVLFSKDNFFVSASKEINNKNLIENELDSYWLVKVFCDSTTLESAEQLFKNEITQIESFFPLFKVEIDGHDDFKQE